jgi:hypothetical protein
MPRPEAPIDQATSARRSRAGGIAASGRSVKRSPRSAEGDAVTQQREQGAAAGRGEAHADAGEHPLQHGGALVDLAAAQALEAGPAQQVERGLAVEVLGGAQVGLGRLDAAAVAGEGVAEEAPQLRARGVVGGLTGATRRSGLRVVRVVVVVVRVVVVLVVVLVVVRGRAGRRSWSRWTRAAR